MAASDASTTSMFGPLTFTNTQLTEIDHLTEETNCILCKNTFNLLLGFDIFIKHLFEVHHVVIEEVQHIHNLPAYLQYWKHKFEAEPIAEIIPTVKIEPTNDHYYFLSTLLKEDKSLRHRLTLEHTLSVQEFERTDASYTRSCLFCRLSFEGTRPDFVRHLAADHNLQLGNPQNLVHIEALIDQIAAKFDALKCLFCSRQFPDRNILKEHMRKKLHKRINPTDAAYDRFYIINYLEPEEQRGPKDDDLQQVCDGANSDAEYSDWNEKEDSINCLFCRRNETNINNLCLHMEADHEFDFVEVTKELDFYQRVKFVNYVRRQVHRNRCFYCDCRFEGFGELERHLVDEEHYKVPEIRVFDQPEFYFPTYENDAFLYLIDDVED